MKKPRPCPACGSPPVDATIHVTHRGKLFELFVRRCPALHVQSGKCVSQLTADGSWDHAVRHFLALRRIVNLLRSQSS